MHPRSRTLRAPCRGLVRPGALALFFLLLAILGAAPSTACRFWGLIGGRYPRDLINDHLRIGSVANLRTLGGANRDGWGFGFFLRRSTQLQSTGPFCWRGGTPANHATDPDYDRAVDDLSRMRPRALLGHVRAGTSGHWGIPNPHPFEHEGILFAHNGVISEGMLVDMLMDGDSRYLNTYPPDYVNGYIDSELYFLYILKAIREAPGHNRAAGIIQAVRAIEDVAPGLRLNFVMTAGDTLYALRCSAYDGGDPVRYYPGNVSNSFYWVAASTVMGSHPQAWGTVPPRTLALFAARRPPVFLPIDGPIRYEADRQTELAVIGAAWPNPMRDTVAITALIPENGAEVALEVIDPLGRLVWKEGPRWIGPGQTQIHWSGQDREGRQVASGSYFLKLRAGQTERKQKITRVR